MIISLRMRRSLIIWFVFPIKLMAMNCDSIKFPRECHCQRSRQSLSEYPNSIRLKCRQLSFPKKNFSWTNISFDRLIFEQTNDNLTLTTSLFTNLNIRILRFHIENIFFQDSVFQNATIGQLLITNGETLAGIHFDGSNSIFSNSIITNLDFKSIDFQQSISDSIFANSTIQTLSIQASKFYGFLLSNSSISLKIFSIISSINVSNLTEIYLPQNLDQFQLEQIEYRDNDISHLNPFLFHSYERFRGKLILENNRLVSLDPNAFRKLFSIEMISLKKNFLKYLPTKLFVDCQQLIKLDLSFNQLNILENFLFENLQQLQILLLNHNPIEIIQAETFSNLKQLKEIHLENIHILQQDPISWLWNLANSNVIHLLKTDFELSDVAFCILSNYNQSLVHFSREHLCLCSIHYFQIQSNHSTIIYPTNYLRLTPICSKKSFESNFLLKSFDQSCDYQFDFLDCNAMVTTTIQTTTTSTLSIQTSTLAKPLNNIRKLFTVLTTLIAITICAVLFVFFWYRMKSIIKRRRKKQTFVDQQRHFNSPAFQHSLVSKYMSSNYIDNQTKSKNDLLENLLENKL